MKKQQLRQFFNFDDTVNEYLIAGLSYLTVDKCSVDNEFDLNQQALCFEKGLLYKDMFNISDLKLIDRIFFLLEKFTEFDESLEIVDCQCTVYRTSLQQLVDDLAATIAPTLIDSFKRNLIQSCCILQYRDTLLLLHVLHDSASNDTVRMRLLLFSDSLRCYDIVQPITSIHWELSDLLLHAFTEIDRNRRNHTLSHHHMELLNQSNETRQIAQLLRNQFQATIVFVVKDLLLHSSRSRSKLGALHNPSSAVAGDMIEDLIATVKIAFRATSNTFHNYCTITAVKLAQYPQAFTEHEHINQIKAVRQLILDVKDSLQFDSAAAGAANIRCSASPRTSATSDNKLNSLSDTSNDSNYINHNDNNMSLDVVNQSIFSVHLDRIAHPLDEHMNNNSVVLSESVDVVYLDPINSNISATGSKIAAAAADDENDDDEPTEVGNTAIVKNKVPLQSTSSPQKSRNSTAASARTGNSEVTNKSASKVDNPIDFYNATAFVNANMQPLTQSLVGELLQSQEGENVFSFAQRAYEAIRDKIIYEAESTASASGSGTDSENETSLIDQNISGNNASFATLERQITQDLLNSNDKNNSNVTLTSSTRASQLSTTTAPTASAIKIDDFTAPILSEDFLLDIQSNTTNLEYNSNDYVHTQPISKNKNSDSQMPASSPLRHSHVTLRNTHKVDNNADLHCTYVGSSGHCSTPKQNLSHIFSILDKTSSINSHPARSPIIHTRSNTNTSSHESDHSSTDTSADIPTDCLNLTMPTADAPYSISRSRNDGNTGAAKQPNIANNSADNKDRNPWGEVQSSPSMIRTSRNYYDSASAVADNSNSSPQLLRMNNHNQLVSTNNALFAESPTRPVTLNNSDHSTKSNTSSSSNNSKNSVHTFKASIERKESAAKFVLDGVRSIDTVADIIPSPARFASVESDHFGGGANASSFSRSKHLTSPVKVPIASPQRDIIPHPVIMASPRLPASVVNTTAAADLAPPQRPLPSSLDQANLLPPIPPTRLSRAQVPAHVSCLAPPSATNSPNLDEILLKLNSTCIIIEQKFHLEAVKKNNRRIEMGKRILTILQQQALQDQEMLRQQQQKQAVQVQQHPSAMPSHQQLPPPQPLTARSSNNNNNSIATPSVVNIPEFQPNSPAAQQLAQHVSMELSTDLDFERLRNDFIANRKSRPGPPPSAPQHSAPRRPQSAMLQPEQPTSFQEYRPQEQQRIHQHIQQQSGYTSPIRPISQQQRQNDVPMNSQERRATSAPRSGYIRPTAFSSAEPNNCTPQDNNVNSDHRSNQINQTNGNTNDDRFADRKQSFIERLELERKRRADESKQTANANNRAASAPRTRAASRKEKLTNYQQIKNAMNYVCLAGPHLEKQRIEALQLLDFYYTGRPSMPAVLSEFDLHTSHKGAIQQFVLMFYKSKTLSFKGLYAIDPEKKNGAIFKVFGKGPQTISDADVFEFLKFESSTKSFKSLPVHSVSSAIDGVILDPVQLKNNRH